MPLSGYERRQIRKYLGWDVLELNTGIENVRLESALTTVDADADTLRLLQDPLIVAPAGSGSPGILAQLYDVEERLLAAKNRLKADKVGSIELNRAELVQLNREGMRLASQLAHLIGVEIKDGGAFFGTGNGSFGGGQRWAGV